MTDQVIERLKACQDRLRSVRANGIDAVMLHAGTRGVTIRNFGATHVPDADAPTIEEALCIFERNVANAVSADRTLAQTIGIAAE